MDQGFAPQGFAVNDVATGARHAAAQPVKAAASLGHVAHDVNKAASVARTLKQAKVNAQDAKDQATEARWHGLKSEAMLPITLEFFGMIGGFLTGKLGLTRTRAVLRGGLKSVAGGFRETTLSEFLQAPANILKSAAKEIEIVDTEALAKGRKATGWAAGIGEHAKTMATHAEGWEKSTKSFFKPIGDAIQGNTFGKALMNGMGRGAGKVSIFYALIGAGAIAGITAIGYKASAESRQAKQAFAALNKDLGGDTNSTFYRAVQAAQKSNHKSVLIRNGVKATGEVIDVAAWSTMGAGMVGGALFGAQMLTMKIDDFMPGNPFLGAYVALQKNDKGEIQLAPDGKVEAVRHLVAAMPAVAAKGGMYNRLAQPIAAEMVARNLSTQQIVQLLGNDAAFTQLSSEVEAKRAQAATADVKAKVANDTTGVATPSHPAAVQAQSAISSAVNAQHPASNTPTLKIAANDTTHVGTISSQQRHMG